MSDVIEVVAAVLVCGRSMGVLTFGSGAAAVDGRARSSWARCCRIGEASVAGSEEDIATLSAVAGSLAVGDTAGDTERAAGKTP